MAKSAQKIEARWLRKKGFSINSIAEKTGLTKSTISKLCRDIKLSQKQKEKLWGKAKARDSRAFKEYCERKRLETKEKIELLKERGIDEMGNLSNRDLFIAGVSLYWAEGFKKDSRMGFANSDPAMIKFHLSWLRDCLGVKDEEISLCLTLNKGYKENEGKIKKYWENVVNIPNVHFTKTFYQKVKWKKKYEKPEDYFGVLRVRVVKSLDLLRRVYGYIEGLKKSVS